MVRDNRHVADLIREHRHALLVWLRRRFGHRADSEDVVQEAFARLLRQEPEKLHSIEWPQAWLKRVATRLVLDAGRRDDVRDRGAANLLAQYESRKHDEDPAERADYAERLERLQRAVQKLPPKCRHVFILNRFQQLSYREIAVRLDISESMVEKHMARALYRLARILEDIRL